MPTVRVCGSPPDRPRISPGARRIVLSCSHRAPATPFHEVTMMLPTSMRQWMFLMLVLCATLVRADEKPKALTPEVQTAEWAVKWWMPRHEQKLAEIKQRGDEIKLLMIGDSITHGWENSGKKVWDEYYAKRGAINLGFSGDRTEQVLWRLEHGEIDGVHPKLAVIMIGTNNTGHRQDPPAETAAGIKAIVDDLRQKLPNMKILLLAVFPRGATPDDKLRKINAGVNEIIAGFADNEHVYYMDINHVFVTDDGTLTKEMMPDLLHPREKGYKLWAEAIEPTVRKLMGDGK
ncbi:MAG: acetylglucosamine-6-sulfatase [Planctomycetes bacterium]|nr:acetylglucosamine-6-sulfatase [Planctomycetota bacterium]